MPGYTRGMVERLENGLLATDRHTDISDNRSSLQQEASEVVP
jgi:hypothetical protein